MPWILARNRSNANHGDHMSEDEESLLKEHVLRPVKQQQYTSASRQLRFSLVANVILLLASLLSWSQTLSVSKKFRIRTAGDIYTPAEKAVEYKKVMFTGASISERTKYQGSSEETNKAWEDLYNDFGISQIPPSSAALLPNATIRNANDPSSYIVQLDVFHQIHCLNYLRKAVYPHIFPEQADLSPDSENVVHLEHCYDQLRQVLMCHSDTATIFWEWVPEQERVIGSLQTMHECKDFEKIKQWAVDNAMVGDIQSKVYVDGAPIRHRPVEDAPGNLIHDHSEHHGHP